MSEIRKPRHIKRRRKTKASRHSGSTFGELFSHGAPVFLKIAGATVVTPVAVVYGLTRGNAHLALSPMQFILILLGSVVVGAILGTALSLKDVVDDRMERGLTVAFPLKLLFGYGIASLLLVWFPGVILITFLGVLLTTMGSGVM